jgi:RNA polymerase subunit RPABC4/transcription elongation factor Spt4
MQNKQWEDHNECPNCRKDTVTTSRFSGITSFIHPDLSWVAKYTDSRRSIPGIYAVQVFVDEEENEDDDQMES